jgi:hypothetical protein
MTITIVIVATLAAGIVLGFMLPSFLGPAEALSRRWRMRQHGPDRFRPKEALRGGGQPSQGFVTGTGFAPDTDRDPEDEVIQRKLDAFREGKLRDMLALIRAGATIARERASFNGKES